MNTHQARADARHRAARIRRRLARATLFCGVMFTAYLLASFVIGWMI